MRTASLAPRVRLAALLASQGDLPASVQLADRPPTDLRLEVDGIGPITLPVTVAQARRLRAVGRPARFGRGERTLVDATVRDTWEIPLGSVRAEWAGERGLQGDLDAVRDELGLPVGSRLTARLHSLLLYDEGQFFLPHQDSEKDDAMIATLVVMLPSRHGGGELVVRQLGETTTYRGSTTRIRRVAFYADCRHEVRPVTSGHRLALTYDLLLEAAPTRHVPGGAWVDQAAGLLDEHFSTRPPRSYGEGTDDPPTRLVFLLDHEYSQRGLGWSRLKGVDAGRVAELRAAADVAGCEAVLALADVNETWDAYDEREDRDPYDRYGYDEDGEDDAGDGYELNELIDSSVRLTRWTDPAGTSGEDVSLWVSDDEVCWATATSDLTPYRSEYEGYMGNWGNTLDRWYRRAAVVVWPRHLSFANRAEASAPSAMTDLVALARRDGAEAARDAALTLAPFWRAAVQNQEQPARLLMKALPAAIAVADADAAALLLQAFSVEVLGPRHVASLLRAATRYGDGWTAELVAAWFGSGPMRSEPTRTTRPAWLATLPALVAALRDGGPVGRSIALHLLDGAWAWLSTTVAAAASAPPLAAREPLARLGEPLAAVLGSMAALGATELLGTAAAHLRGLGDAGSGCVLTALRTAPDPFDDGFAAVAADQLDLLRARLDRPVRADDDWAIGLRPGCTCELCRELGSFLGDPTRRRLSWPLAQAGRRHVHARIDAEQLPVTHTTLRTGRPYTLVLVKTAELFDRERRDRARDQADLDWLLARQP